MGGKRAQKEEVFSIINLLQSFVLYSAKQFLQQPVLIQYQLLCTKHLLPLFSNVSVKINLLIKHFIWSEPVFLRFGLGKALE